MPSCLDPIEGEGCPVLIPHLLGSNDPACGRMPYCHDDHGTTVTQVSYPVDSPVRVIATLQTIVA